MKNNNINNENKVSKFVEIAKHDLWYAIMPYFLIGICSFIITFAIIFAINIKMTYQTLFISFILFVCWFVSFRGFCSIFEDDYKLKESNLKKYIKYVLIQYLKIFACVYCFFLGILIIALLTKLFSFPFIILS